MKTITNLEDLTLPQRTIINGLLARGDKATAVVSYMQDNFKIITTVDLISLVKKNDNVRITAIRKEINQATTVEVADILNQANNLLSKKLKRALKDQTKGETLDDELSAGTISQEEYTRAKSTLFDMTVPEIIKIADHLSPRLAQSPGIVPAAQLTPSMSPTATASFTRALERGDAIELQRILLTPKEG